MFADRKRITEAAARIAPHVRRTPVLWLAAGELGIAVPLALKLEFLQHAGSFKPRGAFNSLLSARDTGLLVGEGVIAASGGNHGAAVAYACRALGLRATVFVPQTTSAAKRARIESYDATLVVGGDSYADAFAASLARQRETGAFQVHAFDSPETLAGQGTVGQEFEQDAPGLTHVLVATGGGGLIGGVATWNAERIATISVEPDTCPTLHQALAAGRPVPVAVGGIAADALGARQVGALMFPIAQVYVHDAVLVTDPAIAAAQRLLWDRLRIIVEPAGATALAALTSGAWVPPSGARVGIILCGGNTDPVAIVA